MHGSKLWVSQRVGGGDTHESACGRARRARLRSPWAGGGQAAVIQHRGRWFQPLALPLTPLRARTAHGGVPLPLSLIARAFAHTCPVALW